MKHFPGYPEMWNTMAQMINDHPVGFALFITLLSLIFVRGLVLQIHDWRRRSALLALIGAPVLLMGLLTNGLSIQLPALICGSALLIIAFRWDRQLAHQRESV